MTDSYPQVLSTQLTFFFKFILPVVIMGVLVAALVVVARTGPWITLVCMVPVGLVAALFWFYAIPIKRVVAYDDHLLVSNYVREVSIPYDQIVSVREVTWINWRPVIATLQRPTPFGTEFMFYPRVDSIFGGFNEERSATKFLRERLARR